MKAVVLKSFYDKVKKILYVEGDEVDIPKSRITEINCKGNYLKFKKKGD